MKAIDHLNNYCKSIIDMMMDCENEDQLKCAFSASEIIKRPFAYAQFPNDKALWLDRLGLLYSQQLMALRSEPEPPRLTPAAAYELTDENAKMAAEWISEKPGRDLLLTHKDGPLHSVARGHISITCERVDWYLFGPIGLLLLPEEHKERSRFILFEGKRNSPNQ